MGRCPACWLLVRIAVVTVKLGALATNDFKLRRAVVSRAKCVDALVREAM